MHLQQVILNLIINAVEAMSGVTGPRECFREDGTCEPMPRGGSTSPLERHSRGRKTSQYRRY